MIEELVCISYNHYEKCRTCDGFGRNKDYKIKVEKCYFPKSKIEKKE